MGRVGANSVARFVSQHYNPTSSGSNVAKTLLDARILWPYLGIHSLGDRNVGSWLRDHTDRDHFFLSSVDARLVISLERFVRASLGSVFEGWASSNEQPFTW